MFWNIKLYFCLGALFIRRDIDFKSLFLIQENTSLAMICTTVPTQRSMIKLVKQRISDINTFFYIATWILFMGIIKVGTDIIFAIGCKRDWFPTCITVGHLRKLQPVRMSFAIVWSPWKDGGKREKDGKNNVWLQRLCGTSQYRYSRGYRTAGYLVSCNLLGHGGSVALYSYVEALSVYAGFGIP